MKRIFNLQNYFRNIYLKWPILAKKRQIRYFSIRKQLNDNTVKFVKGQRFSTVISVLVLQILARWRIKKNQNNQKQTSKISENRKSYKISENMAIVNDPRRHEDNESNELSNDNQIPPVLSDSEEIDSDENHEGDIDNQNGGYELLPQNEQEDSPQTLEEILRQIEPSEQASSEIF